MQASILDLRYRMKDVLKAVERRETVDVLYHGKLKARLVPIEAAKSQKQSKRVQEHPFFGMTAGDNEPVPAVMTRLRGGRCRDL